MSDQSNGDPGPDASGDAGAHALPPQFVGTLFAALFGALVPGIYMSMVTEPGNAGSPVYGLLLPWTALPFVLAVVSGWRSRLSPTVHRLKAWTIVAALLGLGVYTYAILIHPGGNRNISIFLWLPLWQWLLMARPLMRALFARPRETPTGPKP